MELDKDARVMEVDYEFKLDESIKTTKLQLTFHDGTKKTQKLVPSVPLHHLHHLAITAYYSSPLVPLYIWPSGPRIHHLRRRHRKIFCPAGWQ